MSERIHFQPFQPTRGIPSPARSPSSLRGVCCPSFHWLLAALLLVSLGLRLLALFSWQDSLYAEFLSPDEEIYHRWAMALAEGRPGLPNVPDFTPLYADVMALVYAVFSADPLYVRILNILLGVGTCALICLIGRELGGPGVGLAACLIAGLYKPFIFFSMTAMKTALSLFLFSLVFYLFLLLMERVSAARMLLLGASAGLLLSVRANAILMIPVMPAVVLLHHWKEGVSRKILAGAAAAFAAGVLLSMQPAVVKKHLAGGDARATATGAFNFYTAYHPENPGPYYRPVSFASSATATQGAQFVIEASRRADRKLSLQEASNYWILETLRWCVANPLAFLEKTLLKTLAVFNRFEAADNYHIGFLGDAVRFFSLPFIEIWMLLPFGMAGMAVMVRSSPKCNALCFVALSYAVTLVAIYTNVRIRLPLMILLIPLAIIGVRTALEGIRRKKRGVAAGHAAVLLFFLVIQNLPIPGAGDLTAHDNTYAAILYDRGRTAEALESWHRSSAANGACSPFADLSLSDHHFRRGNLVQAMACLDRISDRSVAAAQKYAKTGDLHLARKDVEAAVRAYEKSLHINSGQEIVMGKLVKIYRRTDSGAAARMEEKQAELRAWLAGPGGATLAGKSGRGS